MEGQNRGGYNNSKKAALITRNVMGMEVETGYVKSIVMMGLVYVFVWQKNVDAILIVIALIQSFHDVLSGTITAFYPGNMLVRSMLVKNIQWTNDIYFW